LRDRILRPLRNLATLLTLLGQREYSPAPSKSVEPLLRPLFENYNEVVRGLRALEREHQAREDTLAEEVRATTAALLDQNRALARSERLAALGEVAAGLAHELRNPLAGIQLACAKLRRQTRDPAQAQRLDLVNGELNRLTRRLNDLLAEVQEAPERLPAIWCSRRH
jgi:signal transduction histidine kinase